MGITNGPEPGAAVVRRCACGTANAFEECESCRQKRVQRKEAGNPWGTQSPVVVPATDPSEHEANAFAESHAKVVGDAWRTGNLSHIRVHADPEAHAAAAQLDAKAFTVGRDVYFGAGQFRPETASGSHLLAHEYAHVLQNEPHRVKREPAACPKTYTSAKGFAQLIDLVRDAETAMIAQGLTDVGERIHILRGIYYGTDWSMDYAKEKSQVRNLGFQTYTASLTPDDPRGYLTCGLFSALQGSAEVKDPKGHVDFGHLIIGLDARRSTVARNVTIPSQGGTGLELSTWIGDLGGGAGMLAFRRVGDATHSVSNVFSGSDFGGSVNLEGDVAAYVVGRNLGSSTSLGLNIPAGGTIADALVAYLPSATATPAEWTSRCSTFIQMLGGTFDKAGTLTNKSGLTAMLGKQIADFACWYITNRLRQTNRLTIATLRQASTHIDGAAQEVATVFVDALVNCKASPASKLQAPKTVPAPTPAGAVSSVCSGFIKSLEAAERAKQLGQEAEKKAGELGKDVEELWKDAQRWFK